jgi:hypothetical protein
MYIESASDMQRSEDPAITADKLKELHVARGDTSQDLKEGYLLGIKTAEVLLTMRGAQL